MNVTDYVKSNNELFISDLNLMKQVRFSIESVVKKLKVIASIINKYKAKPGK